MSEVDSKYDDVYEKDVACPKCGRVGRIYRMYGLMGGGIGTYEGCDASGCDYFHKEQDESAGDEP